MAGKKVDVSNTFWLLTPLVGIGSFVILYIVSTHLYPGGSQANKLSEGFSWMHNYWCNLMSEKAINGQPNPARPVAMMAMAILGLSLSITWYHMPKLFADSHPSGRIIQFCGILSVVPALFLSTPYHDELIGVMAFFGVMALATTFSELYKNGFKQLFAAGIVCALLLGLNGYMYWTGHLIFLLPVIQKITSFCMLIWVCLLTVNMYTRHNKAIAFHIAAPRIL